MARTGSMLDMGHVKDRWYVTRDGDRVPTDRHGTGLRWQVWLTVDGKPRHGGSFRTKKIAERKLVEMESAAARGQWVDPADQTTVSRLVRDYLDTRNHRVRSAERMDSLVRNHVEPVALGSRRAVAVRPSEIQAWVSDRSQVLAPRTVRLLVGVVRSAFSAAVTDRVVASSPFQRISLPTVGKEKVVPLTVQQVQALADQMPARYRAMVIAQAGLGLRIGEVLALRLSELDFLRRTVSVEAQIERHTRVRAPLKTASSRRVLPLPAFVAETLSEHIQQHPVGPGGLLFHVAASGVPVSHHRYGAQLFPAAVDRAGLPAGTSSHALRHHYASVLLAHGQSVVAVAELLGHENAGLVLSTYGHLLPDADDAARRAMESAWSVGSRPEYDPNCEVNE